jgi:L-amino acid N-acyltransferase YncA
VDNLTFQRAEETDLDTILSIYNYYIVTTTATFDYGPISEDEFRRRIFIDNGKYQTYLIRDHSDVAGFCFITQFRKKLAYDRTVEIGLYLKPEFTGKGIGRETITFLEKAAVDKQIKVIVASISGENIKSINLMLKMGYERCAQYKEVAEKFGRLLDVVDFQKILETSN